MAEIKLTTGNFETEVVKSEKPVLIDFFATWCGPCTMLAPVIAEIAQERDDIKVCKVDVDEEPALANMFGVQNIPTLVYFKEGKVINKAIGYKPKKDILAILT
ncbi:MAG: thioredoxin [Clostridiales bacterium]|nr:thioredoxin [Clostridiales bacterium]